MSEPLVNAIRKAYRSTPQKAFDDLLREETRWKRKATIAQNKLAEVRAKLNKFCQELVTASIKNREE